MLVIETERDDSPLEIAVGGTEVSHHRVVLDLQVEARVSIDGFLAGIIPRSTDCRDESFERSRNTVAGGGDGDVLVVVGREPRIRIRGRVEENQVSSMKQEKKLIRKENNRKDSRDSLLDPALRSLTNALEESRSSAANATVLSALVGWVGRIVAGGVWAALRVRREIIPAGGRLADVSSSRWLESWLASRSSRGLWCWFAG